MNRLEIRFVNIDENNVAATEIHRVVIYFHLGLDRIPTEIGQLVYDFINVQDGQILGLR